MFLNELGINIYSLLNRKVLVSLAFVCCMPLFTSAQADSLSKKLEFEGDFRFRVEQDWNVRNPDGSYKEDRSRLRYRARAGVTYYHNDLSSFGLRLRTGDPDKQQDPQLTLGDGFSGLPFSLEKAYAAFNKNWFSIWFGKNTFPFEKQNELFWSDNVFPEGIAINTSFTKDNSIVDKTELNVGHFIFATDGTSFGNDSYFQGIQLVSTWWQNRFIFFPGFFFFNDMPNIPDGNDTYELDYAILHIGSRLNIIHQPNLAIELDYYYNVEDLNKNDSIPSDFVNQKKGLTVSTHYGSLKEQGDWYFRLSYNYQERYAAVDFLAQNDWARWDYSSQGSPDGRLTNYKGAEVMAAYALSSNMDIQTRIFFVEQLVPLGSISETNNRVRLDFNIKF